MPRLSGHRHASDPNQPLVRRAGFAVLSAALAMTMAATSANAAASCSDDSAVERNLIDTRNGAAKGRVAAPKTAQLTMPAALASPADRAQAERLMQRGETFLAQGNIAVARQYFARAAESGLALGAFRLAETYDPIELARMNTRGVVADLAEARRWYQQAQSPLLPESTVRLSRLGGGSPCLAEQPTAVPVQPTAVVAEPTAVPVQPTAVSAQSTTVPVGRPETEVNDRASDRAPSIEER